MRYINIEDPFGLSTREVQDDYIEDFSQVLKRNRPRLYQDGGQKVSNYRYVQDNNGDWNRVTNDEMGRAFQGLVVTPQKIKHKYVPERIDNSEQGIKEREIAHRYKDEYGNLQAELGLKIVSPEFDALAFAPLTKEIGTYLINKGRGLYSSLVPKSGLNSSTTAGFVTKGETIGADVMDFAKKRLGIQRMREYINSPEFQKRIANAGLEEDKDYIISLINKRLESENIPMWEADIVRGRPTINGESIADKFEKLYGVTVKRGLTPEQFVQVLDHEIAHFTTENTFPGFWKDLVHSLRERKLPNLKLQRLMRANDKIATPRTWKEYYDLHYKNLPKEKLSALKDEIAQARKRFSYVRNGQERRARAYAMLQEAKRRGISTDELVDMYAMEEGAFLADAPQQLIDLGDVYTIDNLKKYLKNFLSVTTPVTMGIKLSEND